MCRVGDGNDALKARMLDLGLTQAGLAARMNEAIEQLTGSPGTISERSVRYMLDGTTRWPRAKTRRALTVALDLPPEQLGFHAPRSTNEPESPVRRRTFLVSAAAAAAAPALPPYSVGTADVIRLRKDLAALTRLDQVKGGHRALESLALTGASQALDLLGQGRASEQIQKRVFGLSADFTAAAAFNDIDSHRLDDAERLLARSSSLAGMSQDSTVQLRVWVSTAMLAHHRANRAARAAARATRAEGVAAARAGLATQAAQSDPFYRSLAHARLAVAYADCHDRQAALRSLGLAEEALDRTDPDPADRPSWTDFWGLAELATLTAICHQFLDEPEMAEASSHRALATIPTPFRRNRALVIARLAYAQLAQGEAEQAIASAHSVMDLMAGDLIPGRLRTILGDVHRALLTTAPHEPATVEWIERARREWSKP